MPHLQRGTEFISRVFYIVAFCSGEGTVVLELSALPRLNRATSCSLALRAGRAGLASSRGWNEDSERQACPPEGRISCLSTLGIIGRRGVYQTPGRGSRHTHSPIHPIIHVFVGGRMHIYRCDLLPTWRKPLCCPSCSDAHAILMRRRGLQLRLSLPAATKRRGRIVKR